VPDAVLELRGVRAGYGHVDALMGVDLRVGAGEVYALLGPNGAGKTTTLAVASGQITPHAGSVSLAGRDVTGAAADAIARIGVCLVPEGRGVFPNLTVADNLRMATFTGTPFATVCQRAFDHFPRLEERFKQVAGTLSGGEQQMLSLARALATDPALLLVDELSMGLAPLVVSELYGHVRRIAESGVTIVLVEQFGNDVLAVADRAGIMLHGRIQHEGDPATIGERLAAAYLGEHIAEADLASSAGSPPPPTNRSAPTPQGAPT
jgi:branched-chain amino acid transport system ATP-binding protein